MLLWRHLCLKIETIANFPGFSCCRLVMRTTGTLLVVLNTKLWAEMVCEKVVCAFMLVHRGR